MSTASVLSAMIKCNTVSVADLNGDWSGFDALHKVIDESFPLVREKLEKELIPPKNLVYKWKGSDETLSPVLLTAHQDVVPADKEDGWEYDPFSGENDGTFIWGRGSFDIKIQIAAILSAIESLLEEGFVPLRTVFLAFGCDEEIQGENGARKLAKVFEERGLRFEYVLDEGGAVMDSLIPQVKKHVGAIGICEKGFVDITLSVKFRGGHSSTPDNPTCVGVLCKAVQKIENAQMKAYRNLAMREFFDTLGRESDGALAFVLRHQNLFWPVIKAVFLKNPQFAAFIRTSHTVTMLKGSDACNVIPEEASAVCNCRLLDRETPESIIRWMKSVVRDDRVQYTVIEPVELQSTISPVKCPQFRRISAALEGTFENTIALPYLMTGGSDARNYENVCGNIYRFTPALLDWDELSRMHSVNERISLENIEKAVLFYRNLLKAEN